MSSSSTNIQPLSELDLYLVEPLLTYADFKNLQVLDWWKIHSVRFPVLSCMASDLLSIPITTVATESSFSIGSRVLTKYRSCILPAHVPSIVCTRNWLKGYSDKGKFSFSRLVNISYVL